MSDVYEEFEPKDISELRKGDQVLLGAMWLDIAIDAATVVPAGDGYAATWPMIYCGCKFRRAPTPREPNKQIILFTEGPFLRYNGLPCVVVHDQFLYTPCRVTIEEIID